jgi:Collagen triple helix repeat (20 copies)
MFSAIRRRMTFVNVALTVALVFAMSGGAYAAKKYLITSTSQIKPSVLKSLQGKTGPAGAAGVAGAPGAQGAVGPQGPAGANGKDGANGMNGTNGKEGATGPTGKAGTPGEEGPTGPTGATGAAGTTGPAGSTGPEGVCSTTQCTLPSGATDKGTWSAIMLGIAAVEEEVPFAISFPIPLAAKSEKAFYCNKAQTKAGAGECENATTLTVEAGTGCTGTVEAPTAPKGVLCVYVRSEAYENAEFSFISAAGGEEADGTTGAMIRFTTLGAGETKFAIRVYGTYAVTAK